MTIDLDDITDYARAIDAGTFFLPCTAGEAIELLSGHVGRTEDELRADIKAWKQDSVSLQGLDAHERELVREMVEAMR